MSRAFNWIWCHRGVIGMIVFVLCVMAAFRIDQENQLTHAKKAFLVNCDQDNDLRTALNIQGVVIKTFFLQAADSREAQGKIALAKGQPVEAKLNFDTAKGYRKSAKAYKEFKGIDCEASYDKGETVYVKI